MMPTYEILHQCINNDEGDLSARGFSRGILNTPQSLFILNTSKQIHFDGPRRSLGHLSNGKLNFLICKRF